MDPKNTKLLSQSAPLAALFSSEKAGVDQPILEMKLDHNNMMKSLKSKKDAVTVTKIVKTTKPPPVRSFPGQVSLPKKRILEAMNFDDLSPLDEMLEDAKTEKKTLTSEDLMRHPEYLKIDQSKLPLEMFDNVELEALDKSPEEWLASKSTGTTPYYHGGEWIWRPVIVTQYFAETNEYEVKFHPNGILKRVKRLNLQFDIEDAYLFKKRRELAEVVRSEAKQILRMDFFVEQQSNSEVRIVSKKCIKKIHEKVIDGLPIAFPFPEPDSRVGKLLKSLTGDIIHFYTRTMKRTVLDAKLQGRYFDPVMQQKCEQLRLPSPPAKPVVPRNGKVWCPEYPFRERIQRVENLHYSSSREVLMVYKWLHNKWIQTFQFYNFFDEKFPALTLPCTLKDFRDLQTDHLDNTVKLLQKEFHRAFMDQFMDCVQDVYDFFQSNLQVYMHGALHKLFRVLDLKLGTFFRSILLSSLHTWQSLVQKFTDVHEAERVNTKKSVEFEAVIPIDENVDLDAEVEEEAKSSEKKSKLKLRRWEVSFPISPRTPLFQAELVYSGEKIVLEPALEDIQVCFLQLIDKTVVALRSFNSIDKDTMSLLILEPRILFNIGAGDPLYSDIDAATRKTKAFATERISKSMLAPAKLCRMYNEYAWLLEDDDYVPNFMKSDPPPGPAEYQTELEKLNTAMDEIMDLSFENENFTLICLSTDVINSNLYNRAKQFRDDLAVAISEECRVLNEGILEQYQSILQRIDEKPANEMQLADLRRFIEDSKATVAELKKKVGEVRGTLKMLEKYNFYTDEDTSFGSWYILSFPSRVESSGKDVEIYLEADKVRMMDRLENQKANFEKALDALDREVKEGMKLDDYANKEKITEKINSLMDNIQEAKKKGDDFNMREKVFGQAPTDYSVLDRLEELLSPFFKLWNMVSDYYNSKNDWLNGDFKLLDGKVIEEAVSDWWKTSYKLAKSFEEEFPGVASCAMKLREETTEFRKNMPVIQSLASKALKQRHWTELGELLTGKAIELEEELTLQMLLDLDAASHIEEIQAITIAAEKQYTLENNLKSMQKEWMTIEFEVKAYKETKTFVVGGIDDIVTLLDDHIVKTQTMRGSPYIHPIEAETKAWEHKLKYAQGMLDALIACQRTWMYLEPIFGSEDIIRQLPTEARRFQNVDALWRKTMTEASLDANFMVMADIEKRLEEKFKKANEKLEEITKGLNDYLEMKRLYFPRFFFLSNDELLEILSQTKEPRAVQPHLGKCFEGINKVKFEKDLKISQIISAEGEEIGLDRMIDPESAGNKGNVEKWLLEIESMQWESIRTLTVASLAEYPQIARKQWILNWPAQVVLGVSVVYWTTEVTSALRGGGGKHLVECNTKLDGQLKDMVQLVRGKLSKLERKTLGALTTVDVHNRDVVSKMVELGTHDVTDFEWMSQFRYYWEDAWKDGQAVKKGMKTMVARIVNARCLYGYEYLGNTMRLVITALTDRCYRTMIGAIDLLYGGAPEGNDFGFIACKFFNLFWQC